MPIEKKIIPYEILFRLSEAGAVQGCHRRNLEMIADSETGEVYSAKELDPESISGEAMDAVLGAINTALTSTVASLNEIISTRVAEIAELKRASSHAHEKMSALEVECASLVDQLSEANETAVVLSRRLAELEAANAGAE